MSEETAPPGIDITKPSVARVYNFMVGGKDHYTVDRAAAEAILQVEPNARVEGRAHRAFLGRVVRQMAEAGIRQFIDAGSGIPAADHVHEVAQRTDPAARVVYVDNDPVVVVHGKALIGETGTTRILHGDIREPGSVLDHPRVRDFIDFSRPVGLLLFSILHHIADAEDPGAIVRACRDAVPAGSQLGISHFCDPGPANPAESVIAVESERVFNQSFGTGRWRRPEEIAAFFGGWTLLDPGLVPLALWRPQAPPEGEIPGFFHRFVGGAAVKE